MILSYGAMRLDALRQEPTAFLLRKLWRFSPGNRGRIVVYAAMFVLANIAVLIQPAVFGMLVREVQLHGLTLVNQPRVLTLVACLFAQVWLFWCLHGPARVMERCVAFQAEMNYRRYLLGCVLDLGLTWHGEHDSGETIDKVNKAGDGISAFGQNVFRVIEVVVRLFGTASAVCYFSPAIGSLAFLLVICGCVGIFQFDKRLVPQYRSLNIYNNQASAKVFDALSNVTTAKILHIEQPLLEGVMARYTAPFSLFRANAALNEWKWFTGAVCFQAVAIIPFGIYIHRAIVNGEQIDAGTLSSLYMYLSNLISVYFGFSSFYQEIAIYKHRVLNAAPIEEAYGREHIVERQQVADWQDFAVQGLTFAYEDTGAKSNLCGVNLRVKRGERIALVGESGAGKSTFLKVFHGMYANARGALAFDGGRPQSTCFADLDLKTMLVPQEPEVFSASIRENITLGMDCTEEELAAAARWATFDKVLADLPNGLESVINEKGVNLSGGQKQRLALTRALLFAAHKDIVLLDESTSSVDPHNEGIIYQHIWKAFAGKTVLACIHKLNLLKLFDRVVIFEEGKIADEGTFDELLVRNDKLRAAWEDFVATQAARHAQR